MRSLKALPLSPEGLEAMRLADVEGLEHTAAAAVMEVSRPTFSRLLAEARTTVATALVQGWALDIAGFDDAEWEPHASAKPCGQLRGARRRRGHRNRWHEDDPHAPASEEEKDNAQS
jgi:predicted DNA-binding protein (UPF0251 family)